MHPPYASALSTLKDPTLHPIDQNTARFYGRIAYDRYFGGIVDSEGEGARLVEALAGQRILMMANHGILVIAPTIAAALEDLYFLERACQTLVLAYSTGQPLNIMPMGLAQQMAKDWEDYAGMAFAHFEHLKTLVDVNNPTFSG